MKKVLVLTLFFCLLFEGKIFAQDVAIFYDANLPVLGVNDAPGFANLLVKELKNKKVAAEIVDSKGVALYLQANPKGIFLISQGIFPGTIFSNQGKKDPVYDWLREGGIGGFVGDYPFYYWDAVANVAAGGGQQKIFGATVTNGTVTKVKPTELGKKYMPSIEEWTSNRPVGLGVLRANGFEFESYADDGTNADPIVYRTKDMKGWFINFHTSCCGTAVPPNDRMAKEYAELIKNRFVQETKGKSVDPVGKMSLVWGRLKLSR